MKVMVIVKASTESEAGEMPSEQLLRDMGNFNEELVNAGIMLAGEGLHPSSKGARVRFSGKNRTVLDGPFAETKELIAGYWIWQVQSLEEAIAWVKKCPNPMESESDIEIRPIFSAEDFGAEFTPELREQEAAIRAKALGLEMPRFEQAPQRVVAGPNVHYTMETRSKIPVQWEKFVPSIGKVAGQVGSHSYGVSWNNTDNCEFDYLTGVEVKSASGLPKEFTQVTLPGGRYAVFSHTGPINTIDKTLDTIWTKWAPDCGLKLAKAPCYERYADNFDMQTGKGLEIFVALSGE